MDSSSETKVGLREAHVAFKFKVRAHFISYNFATALSSPNHIKRNLSLLGITLTIKKFWLLFLIAGTNKLDKYCAICKNWFVKPTCSTTTPTSSLRKWLIVMFEVNLQPWNQHLKQSLRLCPQIHCTLKKSINCKDRFAMHSKVSRFT